MQCAQTRHPAALWAENTKLEPLEIDCITTIMLKILDGKCKMFPEEKEVISYIYDITKHQTGSVLNAEIHQLIHIAQNNMDEEMVKKIYEQRLYAETMISRPIMKAFKAKLRKNNIIGNNNET
jgi:hypothetical protein